MRLLFPVRWSGSTRDALPRVLPRAGRAALPRPSTPVGAAGACPSTRLGRRTWVRSESFRGPVSRASPPLGQRVGRRPVSTTTQVTTSSTSTIVIAGRTDDASHRPVGTSPLIFRPAAGHAWLPLPRSSRTALEGRHVLPQPNLEERHALPGATSEGRYSLQRPTWEEHPALPAISKPTRPCRLFPRRSSIMLWFVAACSRGAGRHPDAGATQQPAQDT